MLKAFSLHAVRARHSVYTYTGTYAYRILYIFMHEQNGTVIVKYISSQYNSVIYIIENIQECSKEKLLCIEAPSRHHFVFVCFAENMVDSCVHAKSSFAFVHFLVDILSLFGIRVQTRLINIYFISSFKYPR